MSFLNINLKEYTIYQNNNEEVKIIDNFFSETILEKIRTHITNTDWNCQCVKDDNFTHIYGDKPYWRIELSDDKFFAEYLKNIIETYIGRHIMLKRVYIVGQTYGQDSNFHIDDNGENVFTFTFYINDIKSDDGSFFLKVPNNNYIINICPTMNRSIIFPGTYRHKGSGYDRYNNELRICIAWKFKFV